LKVLVSAFWFSPTRGSECGVGWNYVKAIAARHRVWVITRTDEREDTEQYLREVPEALLNIRIHYLSMTDKKFRFPIRQVVYARIYEEWQRRACQMARDLDSEIQFDLIHQLNGIGFREPGYLWTLGKPFVWGPVGGLQYFPLRLIGAVPFRSRPFFVLKNLSTALAMYSSQRPRRAAISAGAIFAATENVAEKIRRVWRREATVLCEVTPPAVERKLPARREPGQPMKIVWSGFCEPRKALNIVLLALRRLLRSPADWHLTVVGDGPLLKAWSTLAERIGIGARCTFLGGVSRAEVQAIMAQSHCLVQPSLYDATTTVLVEAQVHGLPVICLDHFGFADAVDATCGVKIPVGPLRQVVQQFAAAIESLAMDENLRYEMAMAAQDAVSRASIEHKGAVLNKIYSKVLRVEDPDEGEQSGGSPPAPPLH